MALSVVGVAVWGVVVGYGMSYLIGATHPNLILRWIFGFGLGAYVAVPNFGLFNESTLHTELFDGGSLMLALSVFFACYPRRCTACMMQRTSNSGCFAQAILPVNAALRKSS